MYCKDVHHIFSLETNISLIKSSRSVVDLDKIIVGGVFVDLVISIVSTKIG